MKFDRDTHITIIGMGRLMEALRPCYAALLETPARLGAQVRAVTMDARDLAAKNARLGFPVTLGDNEAALRENRPDLILFAPPPEAALPLAETVLRPYLDECRREGRPLPVIFAFPPSPRADAYVSVLGEDAPVVGCVPCLGTDSGDILVTYPSDRAPAAEDASAVHSFFAPVGVSKTLRASALYDLLGSMCLYPLVYCLLPDVQRLLTPQRPVSDTAVYGESAEGLSQYLAAGQLPNDAVQRCLTTAAVSWAEGICDYQTASGLPATRSGVAAELLGYLTSGAQLSAQALQNLHRSFATPGGIAELLLMEYRGRTHGGLARCLADGADETALSSYLATETRRLCLCAARRAAAVHIPLCTDGALSGEQAAFFTHALLRQAEEASQPLTEETKTGLAALRSTVPAALYKDCGDILHHCCMSEDADRLLWQARIDFGARWGQAPAFSFLTPAL